MMNNMTNGKLGVTHTFSECVENHAGMQTIGEKRAVGLSEETLAAGAARWDEDPSRARSVTHELKQDGERASVVVFPGGVDGLLGEGAADALLEESLAQPFDRQFLNTRRRVVQTKHGRHNNCYADAAQEPDVAQGKGTVIAFDTCPRISSLREALPRVLGDEVQGLLAETNKYYDVSQSKVGIGFHGDTERSVVVGVRLGEGSASMPLRFQWYRRSKAISKERVVPLRHGDIYVMSHKATGHDWLRRKGATLRHGAGRKAAPRAVEQE